MGRVGDDVHRLVDGGLHIRERHAALHRGEVLAAQVQPGCGHGVPGERCGIGDEAPVEGQPVGSWGSRPSHAPFPAEPAPDAARAELDLVGGELLGRSFERAAGRLAAAEGDVDLRDLVVAELEVADAAAVVLGGLRVAPDVAR